MTNKSELKFGSQYSLAGYSNIGIYYALSFTKKFDKLSSFYHRLNEFRNLVLQTEKAKIKKRECA